MGLTRDIWSGRLIKAIRLFWLDRGQRHYRQLASSSGLFDQKFYLQSHPTLHPLFRAFPLRHFILWGERMGLQPNPGFSSENYLRLNPDVARAGVPAFRHFLERGQQEGRPITASVLENLPMCAVPVLRFDPDRPKAPQAIALHLYYPDLWPEFEQRLLALDFAYDLFVTITWRGPDSDALAAQIRDRFPAAFVLAVPNHGRDVLPFFRLLNAGAFDGYRAVCKLHSKKSPHRVDGDAWRRHLVDGVVPDAKAHALLDRFLADRSAAMLVADGQALDVDSWWGSNRDMTRDILRRIECQAALSDMRFPAGSIWWAKPVVIGMLKALRITPEMFAAEQGQVDGTLAHALERAMGGIVRMAGMRVAQTGDLKASEPAPRPAFVSAFYLPQFHPIPENDRWWGKGFTEWRAALRGQSMFAGHLQPMLPGDLGYYDLRATEVMGAQRALARQAGVNAFCVYYYWFDPARVLSAPLDGLLRRPDIDFPFYLCWANESWRRNWDGLSGEVLLEQSYAPGFETRLAASVAPYMRDARYMRPDGRRPRFVIYRPTDMPDPRTSLPRLRAAFAAEGFDAVELGAVAFHVDDRTFPEDLVDFWIEMPPHRLVGAEELLFGGPAGNRMGQDGPADGFAGLIYDYAAVARKSVLPRHRRSLPSRTIAGIMPGWDNTARRGPKAHIALGGTPAAYRAWLDDLCRHALVGSYRQELFINAWNEWAEKAVLEPSETFGQLYLDMTRAVLRDG